MSVTYVAAAARDSQRTQRDARRVGLSDLLLAATSGVAILAITLAYVGRLSAFERSENSAAHAQIVNLNTVADPEPLESVLGTAFANAHDRRFAAGELFRFLVDERNQGRTLPNVGAIARASVRAENIDGARDLEAFAERLRVARENAVNAGRMPPAIMPLFTPADLAVLKPFLNVRSRGMFRRQVLLFSVLYVLGFHLVALVWRWRGIQGDRLLLATAHLLTAVAFSVLLSRPDPLRDSVLFVRYTEATVLGLVFMTGLSLIDFSAAAFVELSYLPLIGALSLSALLVLFGSGPGGSAAKVNLGPLQPIEAIRLLLALFLAGYFARRWELLRQLRSKVSGTFRLPPWIELPRGEYLLPVLVGVGAALAFFVLQKDLGPALFLCCVFLAVYAVARGRVGMAVAGFALLILGFYIGYRLHVSATLADRVRMWQSPWDNAAAGGDQVTHAIWAMATGGPFGTGLGLGDSRYLPAGHTDLILAAIGEELGAVGLIAVAVAYAVMAWRGFRIGRLAPNDYGFFLATALTLFLIVPALIMASGVIGVTPLTGIVTPFVSYGGSAMVANFAALGVLSAIRAVRRPPGDFTPFRVPMKYLGAALAVSALALTAVVINVQVVHANDYIVKPHLGTQADGGRRFEYNPRVLDLVRQMPRGTVYDRRGVPLATEDRGVIAGAREKYQRLGVSLEEACPEPGERCYPLGGRAFHLLGDARTRVNWSAPNTSYVERDAEDRLRGFADHASTIQTTDSAGRPMLTVRREYRELVPALRHRYEPDHPAIAALRNRPHDVRLTIDANLQLRLSAIIAAYAKKSAGKAAAVVIDPDTGDLLASASYPWPAARPSDGAASATGNVADPLLDRARYGLYPPGSTFKLVTASAALRQGSDFTKTAFTCLRLPDGRVGAKINGWSRPIRDDALDTHPHGTINMHDGLVHSCNAYFAQLAVQLGPDPLLDAAARLGISLTPSSNALARVRETLPQVGYGQGDVVATPLRMARVVAAVASDGVLHETHWVQSGAAPLKGDIFLDSVAARLLAGYMRDVVVSGTGRSLRGHALPIAGKTGTAELSGRPSHGWFIGFAPYRPATRRIAFAIIIENAGYGGASAAPAAGEIVTAAASAGLIK
jgi:cell division protein FtsW (lipid II flippase)